MGETMKELEYPFDEKYILSKKKYIKKILLEEIRSQNYIKKRIAILGGSTTNNIKQILELFLLNQGIYPEFYESEYNRYYEESVFRNDVLERFQPDIIYIHTTNKNINRVPTMTDSKEQIDEMIRVELNKFTTMWDNISKTYKCPIIQNNFEMPFYRLLGNKDVSDIHGATNYISRLNMQFYTYAQNNKDFYICDINYISADYGLKKWSDPFYWYMYKYALNVSAIPYLAFNVANIIKSIYGKNKKGLVLDLDNTLWGGIVGDDGVDNIKLGPEESNGQAYSEFQRYIKAHKQLGIVLNINSKNDYENAIAGLKHPDGELSVEDFIVIKANWNSKDLNFEEIARQLNVLPESLVFLDDNPAERDIITAQFPDVCAPEIDMIQDYIQIVDRSGFFEVTNVSDDDIERNKMYKQNIDRAKSEAGFKTYEEYLHSLKMKSIIKGFEYIYIPRIAQLTNKSNQFNLTTRRYTQTEVEDIAKHEDYITLYGKLEDKFGDNGVVTAIIGRIIGEECHIELWIMSCRVLKRDMEFAMMDTLVKECNKHKIKRIIGYYYPTAKNNMVREFFKSQGFIKISESEDKATIWELKELLKYKKRNNVIEVIYE